MSDIFVSYAQAERERVRALADALQARGWSVFWDWKLRGGQEFRDVIRDELEHARCIVVVWSARSVRSDWVIWEASHGKRRGVLVPVMIDVLDPLDVPAEFSGMHTINLSSSEGTTPATTAIENLINDISAVLDAAPENGHESRERMRPASPSAAQSALRPTRPVSSTWKMRSTLAAAALVAGIVLFFGARWLFPTPDARNAERTPAAGATSSGKPNSAPGPVQYGSKSSAEASAESSGLVLTKSRKYADIESEYRRMFFAASLDPQQRAAVDRMADQVIAGQQRYKLVVEGTNVPWFFVGIIHGLETGFSFDRHLHNGDPLTARTVHIPVGRPSDGNPPFTWEQSARDAIRLYGLTETQDWSFTYFLYRVEAANGFGYRLRGVPSPYVWAGTDIYRGGKYTAGGNFDPNAVSKQIGAAAILKALFMRGAVDLH